ncbi:MAG: peptidoglycan-binding protein LysM [Desulfuromonadales bacterium]|nr:MAG: peptidoglycan-binding protein LysM [Desulfuromonadales bacterium]
MTAAQFRIWAALALSSLVFSLAPVRSYAIDPRFELDSRVLDKGADASPREKGGRSPRKGSRADEGISDYTITPGDHIFKILMRDYGLSNREAEALVPEVRRLNGITDIRRLRVGQTIRIPLARRADRKDVAERSMLPESSPTQAPSSRKSLASSADVGMLEGSKSAGHPLRMMSLAVEREPVGVEPVRQVWNSLVPTQTFSPQPVTIEDKNFSLSLDPSTFPSFPAADGGRVLVDADGKIPPLVKAIIEEKDPTIRIVSETPRNRKRFMSSLLSSARFYSVEENVSLEFGADPKLTVNADFKIEKTAESVLRHDLVLMNVGEYRHGMPSSLVQFLSREGFQFLEPFSPREATVERGGRTLHQITSRETRGIVDGLLKAFNVRYEADRNVELYGMGDGGLRLHVRADRYFEEEGGRYVVSYFDGDPVSYTLTRLLETRGYRVIMLDPKDDFRKVSEKFLARLRVAGVFAQHDMLPVRDAPYAIQMSGFRMRGTAGSSNSVFLTNVELDTLFRDLLDQNGYTVIAH